MINTTYPIIQAPMAGGISTVDLAVAVSREGGLGFLAGGYKTPAQLEKEIISCLEQNAHFGVNLFYAKSDSITPEYIAYKERLALQFELPVTTEANHDDYFQEKITILKRLKVPYISFTFGCPNAKIIAQLSSFAKVIVTVTSLKEAQIAQKNGAHLVCFQSIKAGGHRGSFENELPPPSYNEEDVIRSIFSTINLPVIYAGGVMDGKQIQTLLNRGFIAAQLGTAFLCTKESGANIAYKTALRSGKYTETEYTTAFSGRPARGLVNNFMRYYTDAPHCYPHINTLTQPIRKQAAERNNAEYLSLWAGIGYQSIIDGDVKEVFQHLRKGL